MSSNDNNKEQAPADADKGWDELKATKGDEYRVKASDYDISVKPSADEANAAAAAGPRFDNVNVNWRVGTSGDTGDDIKDQTAITWYQLKKAPWYSPFQYELTFACADTYDYYFTDGEPDTYRCNVFQNAGTHFVQYRSDSGDIRSISGR